MPSGGRKFIYASLLILLVAGLAIYFRLTTKLTAFASTASQEKLEAVRALTVSTGELDETVRLSGSIGAERFQLIQAPQLRGIRGAGTTLGNVSTTTTPSSTPTFTPSTGSALDGSSNRFSDRKGEPAPPSTPYNPPSTAGSVYNSLVSTASLRGAGDSDFNLTLLQTCRARRMGQARRSNRRVRPANPASASRRLRGYGEAAQRQHREDAVRFAIHS